MESISKDNFSNAFEKILKVIPAPGILLLSGVPDKKENLITIGWLQFGVLWNLPTVNVFIRKSRYSNKLLSENGEFTLNYMDPILFKDALAKCANMSGSYCDKFTETSLTKIKSKTVGVSSLNEALLVLECKTLFCNQIGPDNLSDIILNKYYSDGDYHDLIIAQITNIREK